MSPSVSTPGQVDAALQAWWQGDCALGRHFFAYQIDPDLPVAPESQSWIAENPGEFLVELDLPEGVMVITQTCDLRRTCEERPFVQVAPIVVISDASEFAGVVAERKPRYVTIPSLHAGNLAADLDRTFTLEKAVLAPWARTQGCNSDAEKRRLSHQLARKLGRAALPDDFRTLLKPLLNRWNKVEDRNDPEGRAFRDIAEVRVQATPNWYGSPTELFFWFILKDEAPSMDLSEVKKGWMAKLNPTARFAPIKGEFTRYELMKVASYLNSDQVDLDRLSPD